MKFISQKDWISNVAKHSAPRNHNSGLDSLEQILSRLSDCWGSIINKKNNLWRCPGHAFILGPEDGKEYLHDCEVMDSWIWDRNTQSFIFNINRGHHEHILTYLYLAYKGLSWDFGQDYAGSYIREGFGFSLSSAGYFPTKGSDVDFKENEITMFKGLKFTEI
jgi:hypothetical protein